MIAVWPSVTLRRYAAWPAAAAATNVTGGGGTITGSGTTDLTIAGTLTQVNADLTTLTDAETSLASDSIAVNADDGCSGIAAQ